mmetsp:Transcript_4725/g.17624  ORF Transcript_4725/g.17624 Transcript_4725/m.17624 type:complete len:204 (+) Transcript_4725:451-1062(+)
MGKQTTDKMIFKRRSGSSSCDSGFAGGGAASFPPESVSCVLPAMFHFINSGKSMVPLPSASTSLIRSRSSASVGFCPRERIIVPSSLIVILPSPSSSNRAKTFLSSAICSLSALGADSPSSALGAGASVTIRKGLERPKLRDKWSTRHGKIKMLKIEYSLVPLGRISSLGARNVALILRTSYSTVSMRVGCPVMRSCMPPPSL